MASILAVLLSLGLCLGQRMRSQADRLPRPSLRAENSSLVPLGRSVTLRCQGSWEGDVYLLEKKDRDTWKRILDKKADEMEVEYPISAVTAEDAGTYVCLYQHSSDWSRHSDPLELVVTGLHEPPSLSALSSTEVASGHNVTLQCQSQPWYDMFALYKEGEEIARGKAQNHERGSQARFLIAAVNSTHEGIYQCYTFHSDRPHKWSSPSKPLALTVTAQTGARRRVRRTWNHPISQEDRPGALSTHPFNRWKSEAHRREVLVQHPTPSRSGQSWGSLQSSLDSSAQSQTLSPSSPPGTFSTISDSGNTQFASPGLAAGILVGVSAFLTLLLLFLILLFCHRRWWHQARLRNGGREAEVKKTTRSSDPEEGTPLEENLYAAVNDDRQTEETRQEDTAAPKREDNQEVTYAQLNLSSLKAGAKDPPCSGEVEPSLYAALQGTQTEPRGTQEKETPPHSTSVF
ncbi:leukocyte immunoglobulin-like receptor subfamily B member 4 [Notamacropus eugenii]|uniref:leukocyte immunoglobulin-like receptor subfamily B member 4 n=1 Tax=Notamacropus eugenii TaxID=9315 RepID=UPI003B67E9CE